MTKRFGTCLAHNFIVVGLLIVVMSFGIIDQNGMPHPDRPTAAGSPSAAAEKCDTGNLHGVMPTGVVIQKVGGATRIVRNDKVVGAALDQIFGDVEKWENKRVLGFCK